MMHNRDEKTVAPMEVESTKKRTRELRETASTYLPILNKKYKGIKDPNGSYYALEPILANAPATGEEKKQNPEDDAAPLAKRKPPRNLQPTSKQLFLSAILDTDMRASNPTKRKINKNQPGDSIAAGTLATTLAAAASIPAPSASAMAIEESQPSTPILAIAMPSRTRLTARAVSQPTRTPVMAVAVSEPLALEMSVSPKASESVSESAPASLKAKQEKKKKSRFWDYVTKPVTAPKPAEKKNTTSKRRAPTFTEANFVAAIGTHAKSNSADRLKNIIRYQVKGGYKFYLDCSNQKSTENPFDLLVVIKPFSNFQFQKKHFDTSCTSWVFRHGPASFGSVLPGYKFVPPTDDQAPFYEYSFWQVSKTHDSTEMLKPGKEVLRGWMTYDGTLGEIHTVNKGYCPTNPIPGKKVVSIAKSAAIGFFRHQKPTIGTFVDSSYKKPDCGKYRRIPLRLCNVIATGRTYYQEEFPNAVPIYNPDGKYEAAVSRVRNYSLNNLYQILNKKHRQSLIEIYNDTLGKNSRVPTTEAKFTDAENPFTESLFTLSQLQDAVNATSKESDNDYKLNEIITHGLLVTDEDVESKYIKKFKPGTPRQRFQEDIHTILWECGYYWKFTIGAPADEKTPAVAKLPKTR